MYYWNWNYGDGKTDSQKEAYEGFRDAQSLIDFANDLLDKAAIEDSDEEETLGQIYSVDNALASAVNAAVNDFYTAVSSNFVKTMAGLDKTY